jgi:hypothetical protein
MVEPNGSAAGAPSSDGASVRSRTATAARESGDTAGAPASDDGARDERSGDDGGEPALDGARDERSGDDGGEPALDGARDERSGDAGGGGDAGVSDGCAPRKKPPKPNMLPGLPRVGPRERAWSRSLQAPSSSENRLKLAKVSEYLLIERPSLN